jgi:hypothetical protein
MAAPINNNGFEVFNVETVPQEAVFLSDSQEVEVVRDFFQYAEEYDSFFVILGDGDYTRCWGMKGIVPELSRPVAELFTKFGS